MASHIKNALIAAIMAGIIITPVFGLQIVRSGMQTHLEPEWDMVLMGMAIVFVFQAFVRPGFNRLFGRSERKFSMPVLNDRARRGMIFLLVAIALIWPFFTGRAEVDIATLVLIYIMLGLGLNIVVGFAGLLDLGFVGFYAVGAYTYALLYHWAGWGFWEALPLAGAMSGLFGFLLGFPVLRLRGDYLAIVTLGFGEIIRLLLINLYQFTGGPDGISGIPKPTVFGMPMARRAPEGETTFHDFMGWQFDNMDVIIYLYLMALALALITLFVSNRVIRMPIGRAWEALREDEIACRSLGL
ncbi:MAG: high-affinity branched-chain amino acid ABC transporter permease LivM, partial [Burkholderiaceae bacterium]